MTNTAEYIIALIRALIQEQTVPPIPVGISLQEMFDTSRSHCVEAFVFRGLARCLPHSEDPVWKQWDNRVNQLLAQSIVQLQVRDELIHTLTQAGIDVLPVKGCWLKELYPEINDRQMSDLDILIRPADASAAERLLLSRGYRKEEVSYHHTTYIQPPYLALELHTSLLPDIDEHRSYYADVWRKAVPSDENPRLYRLRPEDAYVYYLVHLNKHLCEGGSGIRSILDNCIYFRSFPYMDGDYLRKELETLRLSELARQVQTLSCCWFETGLEIPETPQSLAQAVCTAGTYGSLEMRTRHRMVRLSQKFRNPIIRFFAYCLPRFFRPLSEMKRHYPVLEKVPILLPVFWVVRIMSMMLHNEKAFWQHFRLVFLEGGRHG